MAYTPGALQFGDGLPDKYGFKDGMADAVYLGNDKVWPAPLTITSMTPAQGQLAGGTPVTIFGTGFYAPLAVTFGSVAAQSVVVVSSTRIECVAPANPAGSVTVTVSTVKETATTSYIYANLTNLYEPFTYPDGTKLVDQGWIGASAPYGVEVVGGTARAISPPSSVASGTQGNGIRVHPTKAMTNDFSVSFVTGAPVTGYFNGVVIRANDDVSSAVVVLNNGASSGFYTVVNSVYTSRISASTPTSVTAANAWGVAGDLVEVVADGTLYIAYRTRGGVRTEVARYNDTTGIVPIDANHRRGGCYLVSGWVSGASQYGPTMDDFRIKDIDKTAPPVVTSISPVQGSTNGGTPVTITGQYFNWGGTPTVKFGTLNATSVVVVNDTTITCVTPAQGVGILDVSVTNANGTGTKTGAFESKVITFSHQGMDKTGTQSVANGATNTPITGWVARSGFTANIVNNGLVMNGSATVTVNWTMNASVSTAYSSTTIYKNGVAIVTDADGPSSIAGVSVVAGDVLTMTVSNTYFSSFNVTGGYIYTS